MWITLHQPDAGRHNSSSAATASQAISAASACPCKLWSQSPDKFSRRSTHAARAGVGAAIRHRGTPGLLSLVVLEDGRQRVEMLVGEDPVGPEEVALAGSGETCLHGRVHGDQLLDDRWAGSSELATKMIRESGGRRGLLIVRCLDARSRIDVAHRVSSVFGCG